MVPVELIGAEIRISERDGKQKTQQTFTAPRINSTTTIAKLIPREIERDLADRSLATRRLTEADGAAEELSLPFDSQEERVGLDIDGLSVLALPEMELGKQDTDARQQRLLLNHPLAKDQKRFQGDLIDRIDRKTGTPVYADIPVDFHARLTPDRLLDDRLGLFDTGGFDAGRLAQGVRLPLLEKPFFPLAGSSSRSLAWCVGDASTTHLSSPRIFRLP